MKANMKTLVFWISEIIWSSLSTIFFNFFDWNLHLIVRLELDFQVSDELFLGSQPSIKLNFKYMNSQNSPQCNVYLF